MVHRTEEDSIVYLAGVLYCCAAAVCWALGPVFLKKGLALMSHSEMGAARTFGFVGAALFFVILEPGVSVGWPHPLPYLAVIFVSILIGNIVGDLAYFRSIEMIGVGRAVGTSSCYPLFVTAVSSVWLGEAITLPLVLGTLVMIAGLVLLKSGGKQSMETRTLSGAGFFFGLVAAVSWAAMMVLQKWLISVHSIHPALITLWRSFFLFFLSWLYWGTNSLRRGTNPLRIFAMSPKAWSWAIAAGAVGLAAGGYFFTKGIQLIPVSIGTPISASSPLLAAAMGVLFFHERMRLVQWAGILCILSGVLAVNS